MTTTVVFDPIKYEETTKQQWQTAAHTWYSWGPTLEQWLGEATEIMLDMAAVGYGSAVLDIAAGAGGQTVAAARRIGTHGSVLATDISSNVLEYAAQTAHARGFKDIETRIMDGEEIDLPANSFDAVISRVGLIYFPDQHKSLTRIHQVLNPGGKRPRWFIRPPRTTNSFRSRYRSFASVRNCLPHCQANPVLSAWETRVCWRQPSPGPGFSQVETRLIPRPCGCPPPLNVCTSSENPRPRSIRCYQPCLSRNKTLCGMRFYRNSASLNPMASSWGRVS